MALDASRTDFDFQREIRDALRALHQQQEESQDPEAGQRE
jgi:hypothetical protein